jgi:aerobic carbon-monoxide dehydrogenase medium subunit
VFPTEFAYARAATLAHAFELLEQARTEDAEAKLIAGGQSLLPLMKLRLAAPQLLIDIADIAGLKGITSNQSSTTIGATTTYRALTLDPGLALRYPAMTDALAVLADQQVRARGTIGGAVAHGDPAADLPAVLLALDATIEITARGGTPGVGTPGVGTPGVGTPGVGPPENRTRTVELDDFLLGIYETDLAEDEIVTAITIRNPAGPAQPGSAYEKFAHPASHLPIAGVCAAVTLENGSIASARVAVTGISPRPYRARDAERTLLSESPRTSRLIEQAASQVATGITPLSDHHASGPYRMHLAEVLTRRALTRAVARASGRVAPVRSAPSC